MSQPSFEVVTTRSGAKSIRHIALGETMHNPVGPWEEANTLYIEPSRLKSRLLEPERAELVLFDVGLGAAANAIAAIRAAEDAARMGPCRRLRIISFERDLELLAFALDHASSFAHFQGLEPALSSILRQHAWTHPEGLVFWELRPGNFLEQIAIETRRAHIVFHDPYSPAVNGDMWDVGCFAKLRSALADDEVATLFTYSIATPVRAAMLMAGFFVGHGPRSGLKHETTQAATQLGALAEPLSARWLARWSKSHTKYPAHTTPQQRSAMEAAIPMHLQFNSSSHV